MTFDPGPFEAAGVLDRSAPGADRREDLLRYLVDLGADVDRIVRADATGDLVAVGVDLLLEHGGLSAEDLAQRMDVSIDEVTGGYHLVGIEIGDVDAPVFEEDEVAFVGLLTGVASTFPDHAAREILRAVAASLSMLSAAATAAFVGTVEDELVRGGDELEQARVTRAAGEMWLELATRLRPLLRHHLRQAIELQRIGTRGTQDRRTVLTAVGFVDLVGYTPMTLGMDPGELIGFVGAFREQARDLVTLGGGRIVKHIGDEIMFSSSDPTAAVRIGLSLIAAFGGARSAPRGGVAVGQVVARHGDLYGTVVNLASRLADIAVPGELLAPSGLAGQLGHDGDDGPRPVAAGRRLLKGFDQPVEVVSFTPPATV